MQPRVGIFSRGPIRSIEYSKYLLFISNSLISKFTRDHNVFIFVPINRLWHCEYYGVNLDDGYNHLCSI